VKTCVKCGSTEFSPRGECRLCARVRADEYRKANPEKAYLSKRRSRAKKLSEYIEKEKAWAEENKYKRLSYMKDYYLSNKDLIKRRTSEYRASNPDKFRQYERTWRNNNSDKIKAYKSAYVAKNIEAYRVYSRNRRARIKKSPGALSKGIVAFLLKQQKGICPCCNQPLGLDYHVDHIIPLALGGLNCDSNVQLLRAVCNKQKGAKHPVDFMRERGLLL